MKTRYRILCIILCLIILSACSHKPSSSSDNISSGHSSDLSSDDSAQDTTTPPDSSEPETSETTAETTTPPPAATTQKPTTAPPATTAPPKVVIPNVYTPTSPGTAVFSHERCTIDYSNASQGYFTVNFFGSTSTSIKVMVSFNGQNEFYDIDADGRPVTFPFNMGNGAYKIYVLEVIAGTKKGTTLLSGTVNVALSNSLLPFLYPNQQVDFNQNSAIVLKAAQLCAGKQSDVDRASAIFQYVTSHVTYDHTLASQIQSGAVSQYLPSPDRTLASNKGICYDYAALVSAMCRSQGIPARLVKGYAGSSGVYHAWNQIYLNNIGWVTAEYKSHSGYNTVDATFYAGAANKSSVTANFNESYYKTSKYF